LRCVVCVWVLQEKCSETVAFQRGFDSRRLHQSSFGAERTNEDCLGVAQRSRANLSYLPNPLQTTPGHASAFVTIDD
jgi:hypothetical protein